MHSALIKYFVKKHECGIFEIDHGSEQMHLEDKDLFDAVYLIGIDLQTMTPIHVRAISEQI